MTLHTLTPIPALPAGLPLLDRAAAAELARVSPSTVQRWRTSGTLPLVRIGTRVLYRRTTVLAYVAALAIPDKPRRGDHVPELLPAPAPLTAEAATELLSVDDTRRALSIGSTSLGLALSTGELPSVRVHHRRLIRAGDLATYVDAHSEAATTGPLAGRLA